MINTNNEYKQNPLNKHSSKAGSWCQQVETYKHDTYPLYKHRATSKGEKIMCIEIMYSVKTLFISSRILNTEALQKSEELKLCEI